MVSELIADAKNMFIAVTKNVFFVVVSIKIGRQHDKYSSFAGGDRSIKLLIPAFRSLGDRLMMYEQIEARHLVACCTSLYYPSFSYIQRSFLYIPQKKGSFVYSIDLTYVCQSCE
jgi:hypothetical protein